MSASYRFPVSLFVLAIAATVPSDIRSADTAPISIQSEIDKRPGQVYLLPPGDYEISEPIRITHDRSGLVGPGRIIQTNPDLPVLIAANADGVQIRDVTLSRPSGVEGNRSALICNSCRNVVIDNVQVLENRAAASSINLDRCTDGRVSNSLVRNYSRVSIDDRTDSENYGFAFNCIDGTGIQLTHCQGMLLQGNRVVELHNRPTPEIKARYQLGRFTKKNAKRGALVSRKMWESETFPAWHQGSAIFVGGDPTISDRIQLLGNSIENAAQGIDIHSDHVIVAQNIVNNSAVGVKAMHGSQNILILGNQFNRCSIHGILLQPGAASQADKEPTNADGASVIANNILADFGYGDAAWMWGLERDVIALEAGQTAENPPLVDVVVTGNVVYDPRHDKKSDGSRAARSTPRYRYALMISKSSRRLKGPNRIRVANNLFHPGSAGVANVPLTEASTWISY